MEKNEYSIESVEQENGQSEIRKERAATFAKNVAKASIEEGVPVMKKIFSGMIQAVCGILSLTLRIIFRH